MHCGNLILCFLIFYLEKGHEYIMKRSELRENVFKVLFRVEFHNEEEMPQQVALFPNDLDEEAEEVSISDRDAKYITEKCNAILERLPEIDEAINEKATGWKTSRMSKVDLSILRLAVYEIKYEADLDTGISINEAVELAKKYGTDNSAAFVNGVLAKFA